MQDGTKQVIGPAATRMPGWAAALACTVLIGAFGLVRGDLLVGAEYRIARVLAVQQVAGRDAVARLVIVDMGEYRRALRTSDWMLRTDPGRPVCVKRSTYLLRRWVRHALALPGFCPGLRVTPPVAALEAGPIAD